jgi:hypothetical protein
MDAIVSNQACERQQSRLRGVDERERQFRFLPAPAPPRISTARAPANTAEACTVGASAAITSPAGAR